MGKRLEWSSTRIDTANYCLMRYHLKYIEKLEPLRLSVYLKGDLLHHLIQDLWKNFGKKYSNAKEFASYAQRMWDYFCIRAENSERKVVWRFPEERWTMKRDLEGICLNLFPILMEEGPPLFSELSFKFGIPGKIFKGRIDEIRKRELIVIRDYKSGKPYMGEMKLKFDPQLTVYNAALKSLIEQNDEIARKLGFDGRNVFYEDSFINPDFIQEFFMLEAPFLIKRREEEGKKTNMHFVHQAKRTNEHFLEVINMIDGAQRAVSLGNVYPERGRKCDDCDMKYACEKKIKDVCKGQFPVKEQLFLDFAVPLFAQSQEQQKAAKGKDKTQKRLQLRYPKTPPVHIITELT